MDEEKLAVLERLINGMDKSLEDLENSYNRKDKPHFDSSKINLIDFQERISSLLRNSA